MRKYIRHPSDIPIQCRLESGGGADARQLRDVSRGGLSFDTDQPLTPDSLVTIRISLVRPPFAAQARVIWCRPRAGRFLAGVAFLTPEDDFRVRMVEQACHIEHYKHEVLRRQGRRLSGQQAAMEWIQRFAGDFP